jgi:integrase/recombinase XerD
MSARPFTDSEVSRLSEHFAKIGHTRNRLLLVLGCCTGYRISELIQISVGHVWSSDDVVYEVTLQRRHLKGGHGAHCRSVRGRRVPLSESVRDAIRNHLAVIGTTYPQRSLFASARSGEGGMNRSSVFRMLREACMACGIDSTRVSTHSFRKTFVSRIYKASGHDLIATQRIVGHTNPQTTSRYLETDSAKLDALVRNLAA